MFLYYIVKIKSTVKIKQLDYSERDDDDQMMMKT